jgi:Zn-dependent peptidase ImmA (M78 family)/DNA-binding XRE family transcriptional regulator
MPELSPSRLTIARQRRGLSKSELASRVGISAKTLAAYESDAAEPRGDAVRQLAAELDFPIAFFYAEAIDLVEKEAPSFRKFSSVSARTRDAALAAAALAWELGCHIETMFELPKPDVPDLSGEKPAAAAAILRAEWGLGVELIPNLVHLLESKGVRVFSLADDHEGIDAFCIWHRDVPAIHLNTSKSGERGRFDCAHELGHLVLHRRTESRGKLAEAEANAFASAFLMPRESVLSYGPWYASTEMLLEHKSVWRVSAAALARRLKDLGVINEWQYERTCVDISLQGWRTREPQPIEREVSMLFMKVFRLLREEGIGLREIAAQLHVSAQELAGYVFGLAPVALEGGCTPILRTEPCTARLSLVESRPEIEARVPAKSRI